MQFNKVGTSIPGSASPAPDEEPIVVLPSAHVRAQTVRTALVVAALVLLAALLFVFSSDSLSGIRHTAGRGGVSSSPHPAVPPRNF